MSTPVSSRDLKKWRLGAIRGLRKAQDFSGVSVQELRSLVSAGTLTAVPWGDRGDFMFSRRELMELLAKQEAISAREAGDSRNIRVTNSADVIWAGGSFDVAGGAAFLSLSTRFFRTIAASQKWPKKYLGTKVLFPRSAVQAYLESLPSDPPPQVKARSKRITERMRPTRNPES